MHLTRVSFRLVPALTMAALLPLAAATARADCISANGSNFNGTPVAAGNFVWFNAVVKVQGVDPINGTTLIFGGSTISFTAGATTYTLDLPTSFVTFSPTATEASSTFDGTSLEHDRAGELLA